MITKTIIIFQYDSDFEALRMFNLSFLMLINYWNADRNEGQKMYPQDTNGKGDYVICYILYDHLIMVVVEDKGKQSSDQRSMTCSVGGTFTCEVVGERHC